MKKQLKFLLYPTLWLLFVYIAIWFVSLEANPFKWIPFVRYILILLGFCMSIIIYIKIKSDDSRSTKDAK